MASRDGKRALGRIDKACAWGALQLAVWSAAVAAALEPGAPAPAFALPSLQAPDERVVLAEHRGKVLYIDFWSAWCAPCREALPKLAALREQYPRDRFEVIGINVDPTPGAARRVLRRVGATYPAASDTAAESATMYGVEALPAAFLVGADGVVRHVQRGSVAKNINGIKVRLAALVQPESAPPEIRKAMTSNAFPPPGSTRGLPLEGEGSAGGLPLEGEGSAGGLPLEGEGSTRGVPLEGKGSARGVPQGEGSTRGVPLEGEGSARGLPFAEVGVGRGLAPRQQGQRLGAIAP